MENGILYSSFLHRVSFSNQQNVLSATLQNFAHNFLFILNVLSKIE